MNRAGEPVAVHAAHAGAVRHVLLDEPDAARSVERPVPRRFEIVRELLDPGLVRDGRVGVRRARRVAPSDPLPSPRAPRRAPRPPCSTARARRTRSATPARCRRGGGARRSPLPAADTARLRRASSRRRRSSGPAAGRACPSRRTTCRPRRSDCRRRRRRRASSAARAEASRRARAGGFAFPMVRAAVRASRRRPRCR